MKPNSLKRNERLKSKKDFEQIYSNSRIIFSADKKIKALFIVERSGAESGIKIAAAVSKKMGNAVWRNRLKRLIKESYRLNKLSLLNYCIEKKILLKVVFSPNSLNQQQNKKIDLSEIMPAIVDILFRLKGII